jgi:hypothetical protein
MSKNATPEFLAEEVMTTYLFGIKYMNKIIVIIRRKCCINFVQILTNDNHPQLLADTKFLRPSAASIQQERSIQ